MDVSIRMYIADRQEFGSPRRGKFLPHSQLGFDASGTRQPSSVTLRGGGQIRMPMEYQMERGSDGPVHLTLIVNTNEVNRRGQINEAFELPNYNSMEMNAAGSEL